MNIFIDLARYLFSIFTLMAYTIVLKIVNLIQSFTHPMKTRYDVSCHVMKIIWRRKFFLIDVVSPSDFIAVHQTYTSPNYVLRQNVSLYCVTKTDAVFIEVPKHLNVYSSNTNAFLYISQFQNAINVIAMPLRSLCKLTKDMPKPCDDVCYMANTGRCGSTLLSQALERVPGTLLLAEPDALTNIAHLKRKGLLSTNQYEDILVAMVKILCKSMSGIQRYCIKTRSCASLHIHALSKNFPGMKFVFGYRNSLKTVSSFLGLMISETVQSTALYMIDSDRFSKLIPFFRRRMHFYFSYVLEEEPVKLRCEDLNSVEMFTYAWCMCITLVKDFKSQGNELLPVLYENMMTAKKEVLVKVFEYLKIDEDYIEDALKSFDQDSQKGSVLEQTNIGDQNRRAIRCQNMQRANIIMEKFGLPKLGEQFVFHE